MITTFDEKSAVFFFVFLGDVIVERSEMDLEKVFSFKMCLILVGNDTDNRAPHLLRVYFI